MGPQCPAHLKACSALKPEFFAGPPLREFDTPSPFGRGRGEGLALERSPPFPSNPETFLLLTAMPSPLTLSQRERETQQESFSYSFAPAFVNRLRISTRLGSPALLLSRATRKAVRPSLFFAFTFAP